MGLLDEAIREHLELKRRRGGDATEIAREEHEALAPVFGETGGPAAEAPLRDEPPQDETSGHSHEEQTPAGDFSSVGQETAELDMQTVLGPAEMLTEEHSAPPPLESAPEEEFDWEAPGTRADAPPEPGSDQERLSFE